MKVRVLGSGTSTGVPIPGCQCAVCKSSDPKNSRLRTSIVMEFESHDVTEGIVTRILVDTSTDLRLQALREGISSIDAVLYTHTHADHVSGIDDLRSFNFINDCEIPLYGSEATCSDLELKFSYAFHKDPTYEGGAPPRLSLHRLVPYEVSVIRGIPILPLSALHGTLEVLGYRVGEFAYLTDCSTIPDATKARLSGLDTLILDGLRHRPHKTHFTIEQALKQIEEIGPKRSFLTHMSHEVDHEEGNRWIRQHTQLDIQLAYDGLCLDLPALSASSVATLGQPNSNGPRIR